MFITKYGLFEYVTMPFGLRNTLATFQHPMETAQAGLQWTTCLIYLDNVIIFSEGFGEHVDWLGKVWRHIRFTGLKLNPKKCSHFKDEVCFLDHFISERRVLPDPNNV